MDIKFSNFKCFNGEHSVKVAPLTLIYGQNSAGKSTLLQLLKLAYLQEPTTNLSGYRLTDLSHNPLIDATSSDDEYWDQLRRADSYSGAPRPDDMGDGIELASNHKTKQNIRIEVSDVMEGQEFHWHFHDYDFGASGTSSIGSIAVEWEFRDGDWYPSALELGVKAPKLIRGSIRGEAVNGKVIENWTPYKKPKNNFVFTSYEFDAEEVYEFLMDRLGEYGNHDPTTIEIFGDDAYPDMSFETLFPDRPWLWDEGQTKYGRLVRLYNYDKKTGKHENQFGQIVGWMAARRSDLKTTVEIEESLAGFDLSREQAVEILDRFNQLYAGESDTRILLQNSWQVFGVDDPIMVLVIETLLAAYLVHHIPWTAMWSDPAQNGIPRAIVEGQESKWHLVINRFGLEISAIRPHIPESVPLFDGPTTFDFVAENPMFYLSWIANKEAQGRDASYTMTQALRKINEAFEAIDVPHKMQIKKKPNEKSPISTLPYHESLLEIRFTDLRNGTTVLPRHVGTGVSQLLPIIAACELRSHEIPLLIQQPELHLHPKLQANLGEYLFGLGSQENYPIFLETHSELLILRILKLIREGKASPSDVAINYVANSDDGPSITEIRIGSDGEFIDEWPAGFFEEQSDELFN